MKYFVEIDGMEFPVEIIDDHHVRFGEEVIEVDLVAVGGQPLYSLLANGESYEGYLYPSDDTWQVLLLGQFFSVKVMDERERNSHSQVTKSDGQGEYVLRAPMPGLIVSVNVDEGDVVNKGDVLVILESMKMQNELKSSRSGSVSRVRVKPGESVNQKEILLSVV